MSIEKIQQGRGICAVIAERTVDLAKEALAKAASVADLAELRLDYLEEFDFSRPALLRSLFEGRRLPVIATCRDAREGGVRQLDDGIRLSLLASCIRLGADFCDIEALRFSEFDSAGVDRARVIASYHNFDDTPSDLGEVYSRLASIPAGTLKIATFANDISDSMSILRLFERARREGRNLIALAMGDAGLMTRILGPAWGGILTFGSLSEDAGSAPGQVLCSRLRDSYRVHSVHRDWEIYGVIGNPIRHSASPAMHNAAFQSLGLAAIYLPLEVRDLPGFMRQFVDPTSRQINWNLRGLSVTIPHKMGILDLVSEHDEIAALAGAANTVVVGDGLLATNTDVAGALEPLKRLIDLRGATCAIIGAGGAARGLIVGLRREGAAVQVFARNPDKARAALGERVEVRGIGELTESQARIVVNATPVGMRGHGEGSSPAPTSALRGRDIIYDLVYNPPNTRLLMDAADQGCRTLSGIEMLLAQAALQFSLWTGRPAPTETMRQALEAAVAS